MGQVCPLQPVEECSLQRNGVVDVLYKQRMLVHARDAERICTTFFD